MRMLCFLFLLAFTGAAALLAYENQQPIDVKLFTTTLSISVPILVGVSYLAGMLSGWTIVGILRRSLNRVIRDPLPGEYARSH